MGYVAVWAGSLQKGDLAWVLSTALGDLDVLGVRCALGRSWTEQLWGKGAGVGEQTGPLPLGEGPLSWP